MQTRRAVRLTPVLPLSGHSVVHHESVTTSTTENGPWGDQWAANIEMIGERMRRQLAPLAEAMEHVQGQIQETMAALGKFLVEVIGPTLRRCGLLPPVPHRTTKDQRRAAKRHLARRRRTEPRRPHEGIAATARRLGNQTGAASA